MEGGGKCTFLPLTGRKIPSQLLKTTFGFNPTNIKTYMMSEDIS
jgi:hypothetical protein